MGLKNIWMALKNMVSLNGIEKLLEYVRNINNKLNEYYIFLQYNIVKKYSKINK